MSNRTQLATSAQPATVALFVSDVHLHPSLPRTTDAFLAFLHHHAAHAQQLYLMGDLFEYWAGDDDIDEPLHRAVIEAIREVSNEGVAVFWIAGNRDFLVGAQFAAAAGLTQLSDPYVATISGQRMVLTHGDAYCTDDQPYMAFRAQVRDPAWQRAFLQQPLAQRKNIIEALRDQSREAQRSKSMAIMDVNDAAIASLFAQTGTDLMIHGHTHRPARHVSMRGDEKRTRIVLPDWDCDAAKQRGGWVALTADGAIRRYGVDGGELV